MSCFLPYSDFDLPGMVTPSFYRLIVLTGGTATLERIGGSLYLFAGATIVAVIAIVGIARPRRWTPYGDDRRLGLREGRRPRAVFGRSLTSPEYSGLPGRC